VLRVRADQPLGLSPVPQATPSLLGPLDQPPLVKDRHARRQLGLHREEHRKGTSDERPVQKVRG
jgi:hypothetical protein